jgi:hypothetical protein
VKRRHMVARHGVELNLRNLQGSAHPAWCSGSSSSAPGPDGRHAAQPHRLARRRPGKRLCGGTRIGLGTCFAIPRPLRRWRPWPAAI